MHLSYQNSDHASWKTKTVAYDLYRGSLSLESLNDINQLHLAAAIGVGDLQEVVKELGVVGHAQLLAQEARHARAELARCRARRQPAHRDRRRRRKVLLKGGAGHSYRDRRVPPVELRRTEPTRSVRNDTERRERTAIHHYSRLFVCLFVCLRCIQKGRGISRHNTCTNTYKLGSTVIRPLHKLKK